MKLLISFVLCIFTLCAHEGELAHILTPRGGSNPQSDNKMLIQQFYTAFQENNLSQMHSYLDANYKIKDQSVHYDTPYSKYDAFSQDWTMRAQALHEALPDFKLKLLDIISEGNKVLVHSTIQGIQRGNFLGVKPTNKMVVINMFALFTIENGKIAHISEIWNELNVMKQMGYIAL